MHQEVADTDTPLDIDLRVLLPADGIIRVESRRMFAEPDGALCRCFVECAFQAPEIEGVVIIPAPVPAIELQFDATQRGQLQVLEHVAALLVAGDPPKHPQSNGGVIGAAPDVMALARHANKLEVPPAVTARDQHGVVRYHRYARRVTGWRVASHRVGIIKLDNPALCRKAALCEAIERELMSVLGIYRYETSAQRLGQDRIRPAAARPCADHRDPRRRAGQCRTS